MPPPKILTIDDNPFIRKLLRRHLENEGYEVLAAECCDDGLSILETQDISLVLLDVSMPRKSGVMCLDEINERFGNIPVIMVTAMSNLDIVVDVMKKGALDYIVKPVKKEKLIASVKRAIENKGTLMRSKPLKPFKVNHAILLNNAGLVLFHKNLNPLVKVDEDIFGAMFTVVKMFVKDSLRMAGELKNIEQGNYNILIEEGGNFFLAVLGEGEDVKMVRENMRKIVERINNHYGAIISQWQGDMKDFYGIGKLFWDLTS
ncbi:MAG: response regulator [Candidatus Thermoplasmatota archaeon]|jgi:DNA-binding response OmpR family regulator|nr:response regulator [Candidatus Thermoplasmatota archaeon]